MPAFLRLVLAVALLPACWAAVRTLLDATVRAAGSEGAFAPPTLSLLGGMAVAAVFWGFLSRQTRLYVFGHELTHALWGLLFGAIPSRLRVRASGGSVNLTKTNVLITLAPYFFPFYTFVVLLLAAIVSFFVRPLPGLPAWLFVLGFTWSFHLLFTLAALARHQPDVHVYGRLFSWTFIWLANVAVLLLLLVATPDLTFAALGGMVRQRFVSAYQGTCATLAAGGRFAAGLVREKGV